MSRGKTENLFFTSELSLLRDRWQRTKDNETLAQIVELAPPGGDAEIGKAIAKKLRVKRPDNKAENDVMWREIDRLYRHYTQERKLSETAAYTGIQEIYFPHRAEDSYDIKTIERQHRRWAKKSAI